MICKKLRWVVYRVLTLIYLAVMRPKGISIGARPKFYGMPSFQLHPSSHIKIGDDVVLCSDTDFTALALNHKVKISTVREGARITIGDQVGMSGACIVSACEISIGSEVLLGANVLIVDTDFHPIAPANRRHSDDVTSISSKSVKIGNNVFVGAGATILKGVAIGDDGVVAAGAVVVSGMYPRGAIIAGNPAKVVGTVYSR